MAVGEGLDEEPGKSMPEEFSRRLSSRGAQVVENRALTALLAGLELDFAAGRRGSDGSTTRATASGSRWSVARWSAAHSDGLGRGDREPRRHAER